MGMFIIIEVMCMVLEHTLRYTFGFSEDALYAMYHFNQSFLIIGFAYYLKEYMNNILLNIIIGLSISKIFYNCLYLYDKDFANNVNNCYYVGVSIAIFIVLTLLCKKK